MRSRYRVILIDNSDSFTYNIVELFQTAGAEVKVADDVDDVQNYTHLVIGPGPGSPDTNTNSYRAVINFMGRIPILGVCLGHQYIAYTLGGEIGRLENPVHGKPSRLSFTRHPILDGISQGEPVGRYHSLHVKKPGKDLKAIGWSEDGCIMAMTHLSLPLYGVQFHPDSVLTRNGVRIARNFLNSKCDTAEEPSQTPTPC